MKKFALTTLANGGRWCVGVQPARCEKRYNKILGMAIIDMPMNDEIQQSQWCIQICK